MVTAGVYLLVRTSWLFALTPDVLHIVGWVGAGTALMAAMLACAQTDIKRVLAYSTVSQLGYMMAAIGAGFAGAGFFHLLTHGVFKALLFLGAGAVIHAVGSNELSDMGGLARRMPQTMAVFVIGTLSLAGIPFFGGFSSKEEILGARLDGWPARAVRHARHGRVPDGVLHVPRRVPRVLRHAGGRTPWARGRRPHAHDAPVVMTGPLWILALLSFGLGVYFTLHHGASEVREPRAGSRRSRSASPSRACCSRG